MKTNYLFPHVCKKIGWIIFIPVLVLVITGLFVEFEFPFLKGALYKADFGNNNFTDELIDILFIVSALFVGFSKEKNEDEYISKIRLESLMWATYINYGILILCILFIYGTNFLYVIVYNLFTFLLVFIIRFYFILFKSNKIQNHEE
ncbi:MAG: hypothetical protein LBO74_17535 [Candidatus Symbiothrix sp.]|jgi:hypothetical protein|nr:hypothetical protein [Candidatus Symbiothrix sp.]